MNLTGFFTLATKESKRVIRIWRQTLVPPVITTTLYFLIFGQLIGGRIGDMHGVSYMQFIAPGLVMMTAITASYVNSASSFFLSKFTKTYEELLVSPLSTHNIIWGYVVGSVVRGGLAGILVMLVALLFITFDIHSWMMIFSTLLLTTISFALGGLINAVYAKTFDDVGLIPTFVLTPLTYLGGVFYSISLLPDFWQAVSKFNPIVYMINGFRYGFLGISDMPIFYTFLVLVSLCIMLYWFAFSLIEKFEKKLQEHGGNLKRAAISLAQLWRRDKTRNLEALMIAIDNESMLLISGTGEVIEPDDNFMAIGSGGNYAFSAAKALYENTDMDAESIVRKSLEIAASICVYTNDHISIEKL